MEVMKDKYSIEEMEARLNRKKEVIEDINNRIQQYLSHTNSSKVENIINIKKIDIDNHNKEDFGKNVKINRQKEETPKIILFTNKTSKYYSKKNKSISTNDNNPINRICYNEKNEEWKIVDKKESIRMNRWNDGYYIGNNKYNEDMKMYTKDNNNLLQTLLNVKAQLNKLRQFIYDLEKRIANVEINLFPILGKRVDSIIKSKNKMKIDTNKKNYIPQKKWEQLPIQKRILMRFKFSSFKQYPPNMKSFYGKYLSEFLNKRREWRIKRGNEIISKWKNGHDKIRIVKEADAFKYYEFRSPTGYSIVDLLPKQYKKSEEEKKMENELNKLWIDMTNFMKDKEYKITIRLNGEKIVINQLVSNIQIGELKKVVKAFKFHKRTHKIYYHNRKHSKYYNYNNYKKSKFNKNRKIGIIIVIGKDKEIAKLFSKKKSSSVELLNYYF